MAANKTIVDPGDKSYMLDKTIDAFSLIGATRFTEIIKIANRIFKENETDFRNKERLFEQPDQQFYDTYKHENLHELTIKFIRNNIESFIDK